jgi:transposase
MASRSKVQVYEQIRRVHDREGLSIRALAVRFRVHRRDVRAALASPLPAPRKVPVRAAPKLDPWKPTIDAWLEADRSAPRKQRHTGRRVWQRLVEEHNADIAEGTVRRYVAEVRRRTELSLPEVMVPQEHRLGAEGEVDFGTITARVAGVVIELSMFHMRLSASAKSFARAYLSEAQEVFLDGHVRAFDMFQGCPGRIRYDNLKAAVTKVLAGRTRDEADRFVALRSHYGFESFFCQPGVKGAHEKGGVESEVGRFRRRHLVPVPDVASLDELNALIAAGCARDDLRRVTGRHLTVGEHFELEAPMLRRLPPEAFDVMTVSTHRVDRKSRVSVRSCHYSVPVRYVGRRVDVRVGADRIEVIDGATVVANHVRGRQGEEILALDHYLEVLVIKPGALPGATALARARAGGVFTDSHQRFWDLARERFGDANGTRTLIEVLLLHRTLSAVDVIAGIDKALKVGSVDPNVVTIEARRLHEHIAPVIPIGEGLHRFNRPAPTLTAYDNLLEGTNP